jgi:hypothetical protein
VPALDPDAGIDFVGKDPAYGKTKRDEYTERRTITRRPTR